MSHLIKLCLTATSLLVTQAAQAEDLSPAEACWQTRLSACEVAGSGFIPESYTAPAIRFQIQEGFTEEDGFSGGLIVEQFIDGSWQTLAEDYSGYRYGFPVIYQDDLRLMHFPGVGSGSGSPNRDLLFQYNRPREGSAPWVQIDITSWQSGIWERLPRGTEINHGVDYDFGDNFWPNLSAFSPLWAESDANCCPTAGEVVISFYIDDAVLKVDTVQLIPPDTP